MSGIAAAFADPTAAPTEETIPTGVVYGAGSKTHGAIGTGSQNLHGDGNTRDPRLVLTLQQMDVVQVACGWRHSVFIGLEGRVWSCGESANGKLGLGGDAKIEPVPRPIEGLKGVRVVQVSCGQHHTGFVAADGSLYTCGMGLYGQCGHGELTDELMPRRVDALMLTSKSVACGDYHTLVLRKDGRVSAFGFAADGL